MKRYFSRKLAALMAALLIFTAGCGQGSAPASSPAAPAPQAPASAPPASDAGPAQTPEPPESPAEPSSVQAPPVFAPETPAPPVADPLDQPDEDQTAAPADPPSAQPPAEPSRPEGETEGEETPVIPPAKSKAGGETRGFWEIRKDMVERAAAFREVNPDTVGWLYLYDTTIDSPVFQLPEDNNYYLKHNDYKAADVNGAIVSDYRNRLTGRDYQSQNLVLYAHSKDENPDGGVEASREFEHFTELKRYQKADFCEAHPYFLFATPEESMVFEVFAAFHTKTSFVYNQPDPTRAEMEDILAEAKKKSLFDFGVEVTAEDRIMTLSTCCRRIVPTYPNGYRFVVMGRLVEAGRPLNYDRTVTENPTSLRPGNVYE